MTDAASSGARKLAVFLVLAVPSVDGLLRVEWYGLGFPVASLRVPSDWIIVMSRLSMLVAGLCLTAVAGSDVSAREPAPVVVKEIVRTTKNDVGQAITVPSGHLQLVVSTYDIAPGARLPQHKHPFERYAYVIQGDLMVEQVGSSSRVYHAGEFVVESVNRWHFGPSSTDWTRPREVSL